MARGDQHAISVRSRLRGASQHNPAEGPGPDVGLLVEHESDGPRIILVHLPGLAALEGTGKYVLAEVKRNTWPLLLGYLRLADASKTQEDPHERRCGHVYVVRSAWAQPGWGPLLYDAGLAVAHFDGLEGMVPDRSQVSSAAQRLWEHYRARRTDVRAALLPEGCPLHGVDALDTVYSASQGFPGAALGLLASQMKSALALKSERLRAPVADLV